MEGNTGSAAWSECGFDEGGQEPGEVPSSSLPTPPSHGSTPISIHPRNAHARDFAAIALEDLFVAEETAESLLVEWNSRTEDGKFLLPHSNPPTWVEFDVLSESVMEWDFAYEPIAESFGAEVMVNDSLTAITFDRSHYTPPSKSKLFGALRSRSPTTMTRLNIEYREFLGMQVGLLRMFPDDPASHRVPLLKKCTPQLTMARIFANTLTIPTRDLLSALVLTERDDSAIALAHRELLVLQKKKRPSAGRTVIAAFNTLCKEIGDAFGGASVDIIGLRIFAWAPKLVPIEYEREIVS